MTAALSRSMAALSRLTADHCVPIDGETAALCVPIDGETAALCVPIDGETAALCVPINGETAALCVPINGETALSRSRAALLSVPFDGRSMAALVSIPFDGGSIPFEGDSIPFDGDSLCPDRRWRNWRDNSLVRRRIHIRTQRGTWYSWKGNTKWRKAIGMLVEAKVQADFEWGGGALTLYKTPFSAKITMVGP